MKTVIIKEIGKRISRIALINDKLYGYSVSNNLKSTNSCNECVVRFKECMSPSEVKRSICGGLAEMLTKDDLKHILPILATNHYPTLRFVYLNKDNFSLFEVIRYLREINETEPYEVPIYLDKINE